MWIFGFAEIYGFLTFTLKCWREGGRESKEFLAENFSILFFES
jgi:hypothetical protein